MKKITFGEICQQCGKCCMHFPFIKLSENEIHEIETLTGLSFDVFTNPISPIELDGPDNELSGEYFLKFKDNGDCFFLNRKNSVYYCGIYEARSALCRNYPSNLAQTKVCDANRAIILRNISG